MRSFSTIVFISVFLQSYAQKPTLINQLSFDNILRSILIELLLNSTNFATMSKELQQLQKELWKVIQVVKQINAIAAERELDEEEKDKLKFLIQQAKSIQQEIKEEQSSEEK